MPLINRCGGGGVAVETCSVKITAPADAHMVVTATIFKDDKIQAYSYHGAVASHTIDNVICGSTVTVKTLYVDCGDGYGGGVEPLDPSYSNSFIAPQTAGAAGTILQWTN